MSDLIHEPGHNEPLSPAEQDVSSLPVSDANLLNRISRNLAFFGRWFLNVALFTLGDVLGLALALYGAAETRSFFKGDMPAPAWAGFIFLLWIAAALAVRLLPGWGLGPVEELRRTVILLTGVFGVTSAALFFAKSSSEASRLTLGLALVFSLILLPLIRSRIKALLIRLGIWGLPAVIYGAPGAVARMIRTLRQEVSIGYVPVAAVLEKTRPEDRAAEDEIEGVPVVRNPRREEIYADVAICLQEDRTRHETVEMIEGRLAEFRHIVMVPDILESPSLWVAPRDLGGVLGLEVTSKLLDLWARLIKRGADLVLCLFSLFLWLPAMGFIAFLVWVQDRRNPFFVQERLGQRGGKFRMYKFRTMHVDAEKQLQARLESDPVFREEWERGFKMERDPRITSIGRWLRRTSLDELPQLFNVLRNEMSLVGPRPLPDYHQQLLPERTRRLRERVKPGMTGLWQVSGRSESGNDGLVKWDSYYVRNWSIWLDIVIMVRTVRVVMSGRGAY